MVVRFAEHKFLNSDPKVTTFFQLEELNRQKKTTNRIANSNQNTRSAKKVYCHYTRSLSSYTFALWNVLALSTLAYYFSRWVHYNFCNYNSSPYVAIGQKLFKNGELERFSAHKPLIFATINHKVTHHLFVLLLRFIPSFHWHSLAAAHRKCAGQNSQKSTIAAGYLGARASTLQLTRTLSQGPTFKFSIVVHWRGSIRVYKFHRKVHIVNSCSMSCRVEEFDDDCVVKY